MEAANHALKEAQSSGASSALIMFDVDDFKLINDTHGHDVGDEALRLIAATARSQMRDEDILARLGGEEFVALMSHAAFSDAASAAERLRRAISQVEVPSSGGTFKLTVSVGVSCIEVGDRDVEQALKRADAALYRAKAEGKNLVRFDTGYIAALP